MKTRKSFELILIAGILLFTACTGSADTGPDNTPDPTAPADSAASGSTSSDPTPFGPKVCEEILYTYSNVHTSSRGGTNIYAICPGDTAPRMVTYGDNWNQWPRWSPDRSQIAYLSYQSGKKDQLHIIDQDGGNDRQLTFDSDLNAEGVLLLPDARPEFVELIWLPEGDRVAIALRGHEGLIWQTVDVASGEITPLDDLVLPSSNNAWSMSLSRDGRRMAYTERTSPEDIDSPVEIYIQDLDGSPPYKLTSTGWIIHNPTWSPDDSQIIFLSSTEYDSIQNAIYIINLDGSDLHEPILTGLDPQIIAWSPDGQSLAVLAGEMESTGDIFNPEKETITLYTLNIRTGEQTFLFKTESPNRIYDLSW